MQNSVAKTFTIIKDFISEARYEQAILIANLVLLLISGSKISLTQLGISVKKKNSQLKSAQQKIRGLLSDFPITSKIYAKAVIKLFALTSVELIIDRTNWMFGRTDINFLVLSLRWHNIAIPIYWVMLDNNGGNSNSEQRIDLVKWFITNFATITIENIYADREFPSISFISWLIHKERNINFIFRSKGSLQATDGNKKVSLSKLYNQLLHAQHRIKVERHIRRIFGNRLYISARINENGEFMFLVSNQFHDDPFALYARRWNIETMFGNFKSKSFNIESTHITQYHRLSALFTLMAISYCYCCKLGYIAHNIQPITQKKIKQPDGTKISRSEFTFFKYGFYLLKNFFDNFLCDSAVVYRQLYQILNYPPDIKISKYSQVYKIITSF
ncbi:MAG: Tnp 1 protein [Pseudomonadota bacterium]|nr:Tnp 1 protein [Pseudomonadota bacterium]